MYLKKSSKAARQPILSTYFAFASFDEFQSFYEALSFTPQTTTE